MNSPHHPGASVNGEDETVRSHRAGPANLTGDLLGVLVDRYELRDRIGAGAAGQVFEAYDRQLQRLVAVKIVPLRGSTRAAIEQLEEFRREAMAASRLSHPGIVTVHDFGHTVEQAWIVMELVIGDTLRSILDEGRRPPLEASVRLVRELLSALAYAHGRGLIHRDVKPGNILLSASLEDDFGTLRLADFGIAHMGQYMPEPGAMPLGSPSVMAPEQVAGGVVGHQADIWAAGVILYELLTGRRPFSGGFPAIFEQICNSEPLAPSTLVPGLPATFDAVLARALAKNAAARFESARAMDQALSAAMAATAPPGLPPTPHSVGATSQTTLEPLPSLPLRRETGDSLEDAATLASRDVLREELRRILPDLVREVVRQELRRLLDPDR